MKRSFQGFGGESDAEIFPAADDFEDLPPPEQTYSRGMQRRYALLIGNGKYRQDKLRNPVPDVRLVGEAVKQLGFTATIVENGDLGTMRGAVAEFAIALEASDPNSVAIVYFAGHGLQWDGINYLVPSNAEIPHRRYLPARALPLDEIISGLSQRQRDANIVVLDACRNNPLPDGQLDDEESAAARSITGGLAALTMTPAGMLVAYSTAAGDVAYDGNADNSPYAKALTDQLPKLLEPGRRIHDIFVETADAVRETTRGKQSPALFLQGALPPLTLGPKDAARRKNYDPWRPVRVGKIAFITSLACIAVVLGVLSVIYWNSMLPEQKQGLRAQLGLDTSPSAGLSCGGELNDRGRDRFGLSQKDWCTLIPLELEVRAEKATPDYQSIVESLASKGDARALFLKAVSLARQYPKLPSDIAGNVGFLLHRAAVIGLPIAAFHADAIAHDGTVTMERDLLQRVDVQGHSLSQIRLVLDQLGEEVDPDLVANQLKSLNATDPTGYAATVLGHLYDEDYTERMPTNHTEALKFYREGARKGYYEAIETLLTMKSQQDPEADLADDEYERVFQRLLELRRPRGITWRIFQLEQYGESSDEVEMANLLKEQMRYDRSSTPALKLAELEIKGIAGAPPNSEEALKTINEAARTTSNSEIFKLRARMRTGDVKDPNGSPMFKIDPRGALSDLEYASKYGDPGAIYQQAMYYLRGIGGKPDPDKALTLFEQVDKIGDEIGSPTGGPEKAIAVWHLVNNDSSAADVQFGSDDAPLVVTAFADINCWSCGAPDRARTISTLLATYVDSGFVRLVLKPLENGLPATDKLKQLACLTMNERASALRSFLSDGTGKLETKPCAAVTADAAIVAANDARLKLVHDLANDPQPMFALNSATATDDWGVETPPRPLTPPMLANGWLMNDITPNSVDKIIYTLLTPSNQIRLKNASFETCAKREVNKIAQSLIVKTDKGDQHRANSGGDLSDEGYTFFCYENEHHSPVPAATTNIDP